MLKKNKRIVAVVLGMILLITALPIQADEGNEERSLGREIVEIAKSEIGAPDAPNKFTYGFGSLGGSYSYGWCHAFAWWCANEAGASDVYPKTAHCGTGADWFRERGQWQDRNSGYVPKAGDLIYFDWNSNGNYDHVGIVDYASDGRVHTIEGNSKDTVQYDGGRANGYAIDNSEIIGYGVLEQKVSSTRLPYLDVNQEDWYYSYVEYAYDNGIMTGLKKNQFGPGSTLSRAQFAVVLHRMNGAPVVEYQAKFPDVAAGTWYTDAVLWASELGIITGYEDGNFGPADNITREQAATMMFRYANAMGMNTGERVEFSSFYDAGSVSEFAYEAMQWIIAKKVITGKSNGTVIDPQGNANRAECAAIIVRFIEAGTEIVYN